MFKKILFTAGVFIVTTLFFGFSLTTSLASQSRSPSTPFFEVVPLEGEELNPQAINNSGQVTGWYEAPNGEDHAFRWENGTLTDLGNLGSDDSYGEGLNSAGQVVGWGTDENFDLVTARWDGTVPTNLNLEGAVYDINDGGNIVGYGIVYLPGGGFKSVPVLWDSGQVIYPDLLPGDEIGVANAINASNQIVGHTRPWFCPCPNHAFLWENGVTTPLPTLGGEWSYAYDINNNGKIVGTAQTSAGSSSAVLWDGSSITELGGPNLTPAAINNNNQVILNANDPYLWENGELTNLNDAIDPASGWDLDNVSDINDQGWIIGYGDLNGEDKAFLLRPCPACVPTPTPTPSPTATPTLPDLVADTIEVTQGIQDLNNSVRLVAGKRTFVRFHVHSTEGNHLTTARLHVQQGVDEIWLDPVNPAGVIYVRETPNRGVVDHAFLFEIPTEFTQAGGVSFTAEVDPNGTLTEADEANNTVGPTNVIFEDVPTVNLVFTRIGYETDGTTHWPTLDPDRKNMLAWLRKAYPLSDLDVKFRIHNMGAGTVDANGNLTDPNCLKVNTWLSARRTADIAAGWTPPGSHYYGMVSDGGGFMRGCVTTIPGSVASGPTGDPGVNSNPVSASIWDQDGSFGDWYGAHELAHSYGRYHAMFCDAEDGIAFPYPNGRISPDLAGDDAIFGFDLDNKQVYGSAWRDVMTYCTNQWISDFTYEGLMDHFQANPVALQQNNQRLTAIDLLLVAGTIDPSTNQVDLLPLLVLPEAEEVNPIIPGDYAIVLRDSGGAELARYAFTPTETSSGPPLDPMDDEITMLSIVELVPYVGSTASVDIEGPTGVLKTIGPGTTAPTVTLTAPNGGETLAGDINMTWSASDPDGDDLTYSVQYSPDNGVTWEMLALDVTTTSLTVPAENIVSGDQAVLRVLASDGLNTAYDVTDAPFTVPNREPSVEILSPAEGLTPTITAAQTLALAGEATDVDTGTMDDTQLTWSSDLDGLLGNGARLSLSGLSVGTHLITFQADDGQGAVVTDTVSVHVVGSLSSLPPVPDALVVGPSSIFLNLADGITRAKISVDNQNLANSLTWNAAADQPWIHLSHVSGTTEADQLTITFYPVGLSAGIYTGLITFTSPQVPGQEITVQVEATTAGINVLLPFVVE